MTDDLVFLLKFLNPNAKSFFALAWNKNNFLPKDKFLLLTQKKKKIFFHTTKTDLFVYAFLDVLSIQRW